VTKPLSIILAIVITATSVGAQSTDKIVDSAAKRYAEISEKARLCETDDEMGETGELFMNVLTVNSRSHQWRAVGIYGQHFRFFYKQVEGDERRLYPDQLVFVKAERKNSTRTYNEEFLFSDNGILVFYFQRSGNDETMPTERRFYFAGTKVVRVIEDAKTRGRLTASDIKTASEILASSRRISELFDRSLRL
jgi:hypothetical protein